MIRLACAVWLGFLLICAFGVRADAGFQVSVTFNDPTQAYTAYYSPITANLQAAGADWAGHLAGSGSVDVEVDFAASGTSSGHSLTSGFVSSDGTYSYFEQGAAYKIRTGIDSNGATPDAVITLDGDYLKNDLWLDPNPAARTALVPANKVDGFSILLHELGHILAFNGWSNPTSGAISTAYLSPFDASIQTDGQSFFFTGPKAIAVYGGPVPLTSGNLFHVGNASPGNGSDLLGDLMNGVTINRGQRYDLSALDLAIAADVGLNIIPAAVVPEPGSVALFALGASVLVCLRGRRRYGSIKAE